MTGKAKLKLAKNQSLRKIGVIVMKQEFFEF
jgi:hypothetical protein